MSFEDVVNALIQLADWLLGLVRDLLKTILDLAYDIFVNLLDGLLSAVLALISALPVPDFLTTGLGSLFSALPSDVWYFIQYFRLAECLAALGAAVAFRLARKAATLFQW